MGTALNYDREIIDCIIDILRKWICTLNDLDMRMNETFPMTTSGEIARSNKWLSIKPMNFIFTFMIFFFITMIIVKLIQNMKNVNIQREQL